MCRRPASRRCPTTRWRCCWRRSGGCSTSRTPNGRGDFAEAGRVGGESRQFADLTLGIIGFGRIGRALARKSRGIFRRVLAYDPVPIPADLGVTAVPIRELLASSDLISLHTPGPADHRPLLDAAAFATLRPGAVVVNTARGELIDEDALRAAIAAGTVARAALDVTRAEPLPGDSPLRADARIRLTAHTGAKGTRSGPALRQGVVDAVLAALAGDMPAYLADPSVEGRLR